MDKTELRTVSDASLTIEARAAEGEDGKMTIRGYAAVFDKLSSNLGGFRERIAPGAFDDVLDNDVRAVFNHDPSLMLGRSSAGTLRISTDATGLLYEVDLPDTSIGRDLWESVKRGDIKESSFKFTVLDDDWKDTDEGIIRTINKVGRLLDVSPVSYPAYPDATVAARSLEEWKQEQVDHITVNRKKRLQLEEIVIK